MSKTTEEPDEIATSYELFMSAVGRAEDADGTRERNKWIRVAREEYETLSAHSERLSSAQRRRAARAFEYLQELAAKP